MEEFLNFFTMFDSCCHDHVLRTVHLLPRCDDRLSRAMVGASFALVGIACPVLCAPDGSR